MPRPALGTALLTLLLLAAWTSAAGAATFCVNDPIRPAGDQRADDRRGARGCGENGRARPRPDRTRGLRGGQPDDGSPVDVVGAGSDRTTLVPQRHHDDPRRSATSARRSRTWRSRCRPPAARGPRPARDRNARRGGGIGPHQRKWGHVPVRWDIRERKRRPDRHADDTGVSDGAFGGGSWTDSRIAAPIGDTKVTLQRVRIAASSVGATTSPSARSSSSSLTLDDVLVRLTAVGAVGARCRPRVLFSGGQSARLTLRHVTVAGVGDGSSVGVQATATGGTDLGGRTPIPADVAVTASSTLVTGVARPLDARLVNTGSLIVLSDFSDWDPSAASATGGAQIMRGTHDVNLPPGFANAAGGDFSLAAASPLVDRGDSALRPTSRRRTQPARPGSSTGTATASPSPTSARSSSSRRDRRPRPAAEGRGRRRTASHRRSAGWRSRTRASPSGPARPPEAPREATAERAERRAERRSRSR